MVFRASPESTSQPITPQGMQLARQIMEARVETLGVSSPTVAVKGGNELVVQFAGVHDAARAASILGETGRLQFFDFEPTVTGSRQPVPAASLYSLLKPMQREASKKSPQAYYLVRTSAPHPIVRGPAPSLHQLLLPYKRGKQPAGTQVLTVPAGREPVRCNGIQNCPSVSKTAESWYLLKLPPALSGKDLVESGITSDVDPNSGRAIVTMQFTQAGSRAFQRLTKAEYDRGRVNAGQAGQLSATDPSVINQYSARSAIVLDGQLEETPYIDYTNPSLSQGIAGNAQLTEPSEAMANRTVLVLRSGSLPYTFKRVALSRCSRQ